MEHKLRIPAEQQLNELRMKLQADTCCPEAALGILMHAAASFALDAAGDPKKASAAFMAAARASAAHMRSGAIRLARKQ